MNLSEKGHTLDPQQNCNPSLFPPVPCSSLIAPLKGGSPKANAVITAMILLLLLPLVTVSLRLYVRLRMVKTFARDDFFTIVAMLFAVGETIALIFEAKLGSPLGLFGMGTGALKSMLSFHLLYFVAVWAVKMSILSFCYGIFGRIGDRRVRHVTLLLMALVTVQFILAFSTTLFACSPVSEAWDPMSFFKGCFNLAAMQISHAVINAIIDIMVLALPITLLSRTQIDPKKKRFVIGIFALGFLAVLASFGRAASTVILTSNLSKPGYWVVLPISSALEVDLAITCASLPALTPLIKQGLEKLASRTGSSRWLSEFESENDPRKPFNAYKLTDSKGNGGIQVVQEYTVSRSESVAKRKSPALVISRPMPFQPSSSGIGPGAALAAGNMTLEEVLRTTGPEDFARRPI